MYPFTNQYTGQREGMMCPSCQKQVTPSSYTADQKLEAKRKRAMNTLDSVVSTLDLVGRRDTVSTTDEDPREQVYLKQESITNTLKQLEYAGKKKKEDPDEKLLRAKGLTILSSTEKNPV